MKTKTISQFSILSFLCLLQSIYSYGQIIDSQKDEQAMFAETKQVNQFFRRFNSEESIDGTRFYKGDSLFHDNKLRKNYLGMLFDRENKIISDDIKQHFINEMCNATHPQFLNFHGGSWMAEVTTSFLWYGKKEKATLFLKLQEEKVGSKWVIVNVKFNPFTHFLNKDSLDTLHFLHPLSHELEFINLYKVFTEEKGDVVNYTEKKYAPDFLTLFLYELQKGNLQFKTVDDVKFHFFQLGNWYFELSRFNRPGNNSGWLISKLSIELNQKELIRHIYKESE